LLFKDCESMQLHYLFKSQIDSVVHQDGSTVVNSECGQHRLTLTIEQMIMQLYGNRFFQVNRTNIISLDNLHKIKGCTLYLRDGNVFNLGIKRLYELHVRLDMLTVLKLKRNRGQQLFMQAREPKTSRW